MHLTSFFDVFKYFFYILFWPIEVIKYNENMVGSKNFQNSRFFTHLGRLKSMNVYTYLEKRVEVPINFYSTTFRYEPIKSNKNAIKYHTKAVAGGVNHPPQGTSKVK